MKIIKVKTCFECPFMKYSDGGGIVDIEFYKCTKFNIMLKDWDGPENFDVRSGIHLIVQCFFP